MVPFGDHVADHALFEFGSPHGSRIKDNSCPSRFVECGEAIDDNPRKSSEPRESAEATSTQRRTFSTLQPIFRKNAPRIHPQEIPPAPQPPLRPLQPDRVARRPRLLLLPQNREQGCTLALECRVRLLRPYFFLIHIVPPRGSPTTRLYTVSEKPGFADHKTVLVHGFRKNRVFFGTSWNKFIKNQ